MDPVRKRKRRLQCCMVGNQPAITESSICSFRGPKNDGALNSRQLVKRNEISVDEVTHELQCKPCNQNFFISVLDEK